MPDDKKTVTWEATMRHNGAVKTVRTEWPDDPGAGPPEEVAHYLWVFGNYSCDCNRLELLYGTREGNVTEEVIPSDDHKEDWPCGDTVELLRLRVGGREVAI